MLSKPVYNTVHNCFQLNGDREKVGRTLRRTTRTAGEHVEGRTRAQPNAGKANPQRSESSEDGQQRAQLPERLRLSRLSVDLWQQFDDAKAAVHPRPGFKRDPGS